MDSTTASQVRKLHRKLVALKKCLNPRQEADQIKQAIKQVHRQQDALSLYCLKPVKDHLALNAKVYDPHTTGQLIETCVRKWLAAGRRDKATWHTSLESEAQSVEVWIREWGAEAESQGLNVPAPDHCSRMSTESADMAKDATSDLELPLLVSFSDTKLAYLPSATYNPFESYDNAPSLMSLVLSQQYPKVGRDCQDGTVYAYSEGKFWEVKTSDELEAKASIAETAWQPSQSL